MFLFFINMLDTDEEKKKLQEIYGIYHGTMLAVAKNFISDHALAEDAVSESIMTIIKNLHKINDISSHKTKAYIVIIVKSRSINLLRLQNKYVEDDINDLDIPDNDIPIADAYTIKESYDNIVKHIRALPRSLSDVLYLSVVFEHSNKEIAEILNLSNEVVRKRLSRAKAQVRINLTKEGTGYAKK